METEVLDSLGVRLHYGALPWKTTVPIVETFRFVTLAQAERFTLPGLCGRLASVAKTVCTHLCILIIPNGTTRVRRFGVTSVNLTFRF